MPKPRLRLRVYALRAPYSWAWAWAVYDTARPTGYQIVISGGLYARWREALRVGGEHLRRQEELRSAA